MVRIIPPVKKPRTNKSPDDLSWYQQLSKPARHLYRIIMDIHADDPQSFALIGHMKVCASP